MDERKTTNASLKNTLSNIFETFTEVNFNQNDKDDLQEWLNCKEDFFYFLKNYVKLDLPGNENEFLYHIGQELTVRTLMAYHYAVCLKSRQIGITTVIRAYCVWLTMFYNNYSVGIISKSGPDATAFIRKCIAVIDDLPPFLKPKFVKKTEQQYILSNGSIAMSAAVSASQPENTLRSNPIVFLIIDEGAFIHKINEALTGLLPTTVTVQKAAERAGVPYGVLVISTPNKTKGTGQWFFEQYREALLNNGLDDKQKGGAYKAIRLHWKDLGGPFDQEWYDMQCKVQNYKIDNIAQEIDCVFLPSTKNGLVSKEEVILLNTTQRKPDYIVNQLGGDIYIFDKTLLETRVSRRFVLGVDTATAQGRSTFSSMVAIDYDTNEQVLEYVGKLSIYDYPTVVKRACEELGDNLFIVAERNTIGETVVESIRRDPILGPKLYHTIVKDHNGKFVKKFAGIETNGATKPLFIEAVSDFFKTNISKIYGERSILQITTVDVDNGKLLGTPNDLIMVYAFIAYTKRNNLINFANKPVEQGTTFNSHLEKLSPDDMVKYLYDRGVNLANRVQTKSEHNKNLLDFLNGERKI